jgi:hypothetical protein
VPTADAPPRWIVDSRETVRSRTGRRPETRSR